MSVFSRSGARGLQWLICLIILYWTGKVDSVYPTMWISWKSVQNCDLYPAFFYNISNVTLLIFNQRPLKRKSRPLPSPSSAVEGVGILVISFGNIAKKMSQKYQISYSLKNYIAYFKTVIWRTLIVSIKLCCFRARPPPLFWGILLFLH